MRDIFGTTTSDIPGPSSSLQLTSLTPRRMFGIRHLQVLLLFLCLSVNYLMRVNLSVAMVLMTDMSSDSDYPVFNWTLAEQSQAQSIFFCSYFFMNILAAFLVTRYSNKLLLMISATSTSALSFATPLAVTFGGLYALLFIRTVLGAMQGMMMANVMGIMSRWIPPTERSMSGSLIIGGMEFGTLVSFSTSGWMGSKLGWPSIFYFSGCLGVTWTVVWAIAAADSPDTCWLISNEEKIFLEKELVHSSSSTNKSSKIPWKKILKNKACFALLFTTMGHYWGSVTLLSEMPTYFKSVLHLHSTNNGLISALPYACKMIFSLIFSYLVDVLIKRRRISVTIARKSCNSIGQWGAAICLLLLGYSKTEVTVAIIYTVGATLLGFTNFGFNINHLDIIPKYAGFFMGITCALSNVSSLLGPLFAGYVVYDAEDEDQWRIVFWVTALIWFVANSVFIIFGSGEMQDLSDDLNSENTV